MSFQKDRPPHPEQGKCISCGFLARQFPRTNPRDPEHFEFTDWDRRTGGANEPNPLPENRFVPVCYVGAGCFPHNVSLGWYEMGTPMASSAFDLLNEDRECQAWVAWLPGRSPKECLDQMLLDRLEHDRIEHRESMAAMIADAQTAQTAIVQAHRDIAESHREIAESHKTETVNVGKVIERLEQIALQMQNSTAQMQTSTTRTAVIYLPQ